MTHEFQPLVPSSVKGKASFSISNSRIARVPSTTGPATARPSPSPATARPSPSPATSRPSSARHVTTTTRTPSRPISVSRAISRTPSSSAPISRTHSSSAPISRSPSTSAAPTLYVPSQDPRQLLRTEVAHGGHTAHTQLGRTVISQGSRVNQSQLRRTDGPHSSHTAHSRLQPIVPRMSTTPQSGISGKVVMNSVGNTKFVLVSQIKPPPSVKRTATGEVSMSKRPARSYTPIRPYTQPPSTDNNTPTSSRVPSKNLSNRSFDTVANRSFESLNRSFDNPLEGPGRSVPRPPEQQVPGGMEGGIYPRPKKPCNCTRSMCLKLYCDCFANGEFCSNCNCQNCHNNILHESERSRSIKSCLERNPLAFHPKIGKSFGGQEDARHHAKGCHCKRSGCLKNYCECYEAKIPCSSLCKCVGCKNYSHTHSTLQELADVAAVRHAQQSSVSAKFNNQMADMSSSAPDLAPLDDLNLDCLSMNLAAATCRCLLSAGAHAVDHSFSMETIEKAIIEEFGQCLTKIIEKGLQKGAAENKSTK